jgi:uncharacterized membrane protein
MEFMIFLVLAWLIIPPILGIIAFAQVSGLKDELNRLRAELSSTPRPSRPPPAPEAAPPEPSESGERKTEHSPKPAPEVTIKTSIPVTRPRPPRQNAPTPQRKDHKTDWERLITSNWMIWAGGLALVVGALFLIRVTIEAGYFGPVVRTSVAAILGGAMIVAGWRAKAWALVRDSETAVQYLPSILAGGGVITLYGASLASGALYNLLPPLAVLTCFIVISVLAVGLALIFGPVLAMIGLIGAYISPFFTGAEGGSALILLPYTGAVTAAGLAIISWRNWRFGSWITLIGSVLWGVIALNDPAPDAAWAVPVYALFLVAVAAMFAQNHARTPHSSFVPASEIFNYLRDRGEAFAVAHFFWIAGGGLLALSVIDHRVEAYALSAMSVYAGLGLFLAWRREGFSLFAPISTIGTFLVLAAWPDWSVQHTNLALTLGGVLGVSGFILLQGVKVRAPLAVTSALSPPMSLFIVFWRGEAFQPTIFWGITALFIALLMVSVLEGMKRSPRGLDGQPGAAAAYALGAVLSLTLAPFLAGSGLWPGTGLAVCAAAIALVHTRFELPLLRYAGMIAAGASALLLMRPDMLMRVHVSPVPVFNELSAGFGLAILALVVGGWLSRKTNGLKNACFSSAGILLFVLTGLLIRHWAGGGSLTGPYGGYGEVSGYAIAYFGAALSLIWRFGRSPHFVLRLVEYAAFLVGLFALLGGIEAMQWDAASGTFIFNLLFVAFAMPGILLGAIAFLLRHKGRIAEANFFAISSMSVGLLWVSSEVRRMFSGPVLSPFTGAISSDQEMWGYSAAWLLYASLLLIWGAWRKLSIVRFASLGLFAMTLVKVFLIDFSALDGVWRAASFIGLGLTLLGVALFYQKFIFADRSAKPE